MYGWRGFWRGSWAKATPSGYRYIGPCRCGTGPHAFFMDPYGRIVHASAFWRAPFFAGDIEAELRALQEEKAQLEKRIQELEELRKKETQS
ncbi:MAG: hypothetical protein H5U36_07985 [Candidatus Caldatribacterium sp.]|nr:hypothetical protein [Candidatus Caldatribacterium sp.]